MSAGVKRGLLLLAIAVVALILLAWASQFLLTVHVG
jgi:hypothetical protein